jgi:nicotinamidase-related amidase
MREGAKPRSLPQIESKPYRFPFDGAWSAQDTAFLALGFQLAPVAALQAEGIVEVATRLANVCRDAGVAIFWIRRGVPLAASSLAARRIGHDPTAVEADSAGWQFDPKLAVHRNDGTIDTTGDNAFLSTDLEDRLRAAGIRNLLIAGLPTDGLVHATMRAANDRGFECVAVSDACKGTSEPRHDSQLRITMFGNGLFGTVADCATVVDALRRPLA